MPADPPSMTRVGIIGTGFAARAHADALRRLPAVQLAAVASRTPARAEAFAAEYGVERAYDDYMGVVEDRSLDAVHICAANDVHVALCRAALEAGKHVLCEKPLGLDGHRTEAIGELAAAAAASGVVSGVCFNYRFFPLVREIRERLAAHPDRRPHFVHGRYLQDWLLSAADWNWRIDPDVGGSSRAVADIGSHWCDLAQFLTDDRVVSVFADLGVLHERRRRPGTGAGTFTRAKSNGDAITRVSTEDFGTLLLRFASGAHGAVVLSQVSAGRKNNLVIELDTGTDAFAWDQENPDRAWVGRRDGSVELVRDPATLGRAAANLSRYPAGHIEGWPDALRNLAAAFHAGVAARRPEVAAADGVATFSDAHRLVLLTEAAARSAQLGQWVEVGDETAVVA